MRRLLSCLLVPKKRVTVRCRHCETWFTLPPDLAGSVVHCSHDCLVAEREAIARKELVSKLVARNMARESKEKSKRASRSSLHSIVRDSVDSFPTFS